MDTAIDRTNLPCRGALIITSARSDLQGGVHLVREHPTESIRYAGVHPSSSTERPSAGLNPKYKGTLDPCPLYSSTVRGWPVKQTHFPLPEAVQTRRRPRYCWCLKSPRTRPQRRGPTP